MTKQLTTWKLLIPSGCRSWTLRSTGWWWRVAQCSTQSYKQSCWVEVRSKSSEKLYTSNSIGTHSPWPIGRGKTRSLARECIQSTRLFVCHRWSAGFPLSSGLAQPFLFGKVLRTSSDGEPQTFEVRLPLISWSILSSDQCQKLF